MERKASSNKTRIEILTATLKWLKKKYKQYQLQFKCLSYKKKPHFHSFLDLLKNSGVQVSSTCRSTRYLVQRWHWDRYQELAHAGGLLLQNIMFTTWALLLLCFAYWQHLATKEQAQGLLARAIGTVRLASVWVRIDCRFQISDFYLHYGLCNDNALKIRLPGWVTRQ